MLLLFQLRTILSPKEYHISVESSRSSNSSDTMLYTGVGVMGMKGFMAGEAVF